MKKHQTRKDAILAWHFVNEDSRLDYDAVDLTVEPGYIYYTDSPIVLCESGLHASVHPFDALQHSSGPVLCRVAVWGDVVIGEEKVAGRNREVLAMADVSRELRLFACWCVRQRWDLLTSRHSRMAVEVAELFAIGKVSDDGLDAAYRSASLIAKWAGRDDTDAALAASWAAAPVAYAAARYAAGWAVLASARAADGAAGGGGLWVDETPWAAARDATITAQRAEFARRIAEVDALKVGKGE